MECYPVTRSRMKEKAAADTESEAPVTTEVSDSVTPDPDARMKRASTRSKDRPEGDAAFARPPEDILEDEHVPVTDYSNPAKSVQVPKPTVLKPSKRDFAKCSMHLIGQDLLSRFGQGCIVSIFEHLLGPWWHY